MSKSKRKIDDKTLSLFDLLKPEGSPAPGGMNISMRVRHAASRAISAYHKRTGQDRIDVCSEIYKLTGIEVSIGTLNGWTAESRDLTGDGIDYHGNRRWGIPVEIAPAFCQVTGDWEVLFIQAEAGSFKALKGRDVVRARMGLLKEEIARKTHEFRELEKALVESED